MPGIWRPLDFAGGRGSSKVNEQPHQVSKLFSLTTRASPRAKQWTSWWAPSPSSSFDFQASSLCCSLHYSVIRVAIHCLLGLTWDCGDPLPRYLPCHLSIFLWSLLVWTARIWREAACLPTHQTGGARRAELHFFFHEAEFPGNPPMFWKPKACSLKFCPQVEQSPFKNTTFPGKRFSVGQHHGWGYLLIQFQMRARDTFTLPLKHAHQGRARETGPKCDRSFEFLQSSFP